MTGFRDSGFPHERGRDDDDGEPGLPLEPDNSQRAGKPRNGEAKPHYIGHRARLRKRFLQAGGDALPDYELLELILFRAIPRRDTKPLAKALIERFASFAGVLNAAPARLSEVQGMSEAAIVEIKLVLAGGLRLLNGAVMNKPVLGSWSKVIDYCYAAMGHAEVEQFRVLFLDKRNRLIADEVQQQGTVDHTPVYIREIMKRALELSATAMILVHNHPSGDPTPSQADIKMTSDIVESGRHLGIIVHDHLIIGREGHASLRALKMM